MILDRLFGSEECDHEWGEERSFVHRGTYFDGESVIFRFDRYTFDKCEECGKEKGGSTNFLKVETDITDVTLLGGMADRCEEERIEEYSL